MLKSPFGPRTAETLLALLLTFTFAAGEAAAVPKVYIDITKEAGRKITIAAVPFAVSENSTEQDLRGGLENDLRLSGYLGLLPMEDLQKDLFSMESESGKINFNSWLSWGAELLLRTSYRETGGDILVRGELYDVERGSTLLGREYKGRKGQGARAVH